VEFVICIFKRMIRRSPGKTLQNFFTTWGGAREIPTKFAFEGSELVGVGRTIDDGRFYATVVDVVVRPPYQHRGIGRAIVEDLQSRMKGFLVVTLTAAPDVQPFYHRLGWRTQSTAMILPRSEEQARLNCPAD
jgi:GNAT superfamily N-acetyltransferase